MKRSWALIAAVAIASLCVSAGLQAGAEDPSWRRMVEEDWLKWLRARTVVAPTAQNDAAGGCDGVINGKYGFHTAAADPPWWQVDLGAVRSIGAVKVWNRCAPGIAERASRLVVSLSTDGAAWREVYRHDGSIFFGQTDGKPLVVRLDGSEARYVRLSTPGQAYLSLDEIEVFAPGGEENMALGAPADQSGASPWSVYHGPLPNLDFAAHAEDALRRCRELLDEREALGRVCADEAAELKRLRDAQGEPRERFLAARWLQRRLLLSHPLLDDLGPILFVKRAPGAYSHMSDQYYGWWARPGGGLFLMRDYRKGEPIVECLTETFTEPGSFLRPSLSYDGTQVLFAWARHYPDLAALADKTNKAAIPENAFYHVYEMNIDGTGVRRLTHGKYDHFDAQYLPDGRIVFLSTRRGSDAQLTPAMRRLEGTPDGYVRCGGGAHRPVAVYTLHTMNADGSDLRPISPFEMFEWTPSVANDGSILYCRWDYVDRSNMPWMSLWSLLPDGTNPRLVYGNFTRSPHCVFEARNIPGSRKLVFTASAHHAQTMGSLALLDPEAGTEGSGPITRLTPEVVFPESDGWPQDYYANPWPLSERHYLVAWGVEAQAREGGLRSRNAMGIYLFDAEGGQELLYRDPDIGCQNPIPVRARPRPPVLANTVAPEARAEGSFFIADVYEGLERTPRGTIEAVRLVGVPPKAQPAMNRPPAGLTQDDPGKFVIGTAPVEEDGSAFFRAPAGVTVFFQALDADGVAVQTMRSGTHVQPGQTLGCVGCHEPRDQTPPMRSFHAATRPPSRLTPGPEGSWPLRFDTLVRPVLEERCVSCHGPGGEPEAAAFDLTGPGAYERLTTWGRPSLREHVNAAYARSYSAEGQGAAATSPLMALLTGPEPHQGVRLDDEDRERLVTWMDLYAQKLGSFSPAQEANLRELRRTCADLFTKAKDTLANARETTPE